MPLLALLPRTISQPFVRQHDVEDDQVIIRSGGIDTRSGRYPPNRQQKPASVRPLRQVFAGFFAIFDDKSSSHSPSPTGCAGFNSESGIG